jgi:aldehyde dehydrogenase (NAD+)
MISITAKNFIDGGWQESVDCFESVDPADRREVVGTAPRSTAADVERAVSVARRTFPAWNALGAPKRAEAIDSFAQVLKRYGRELAKYLSKESGKPQAEALAEVQDALAIAQHTAGGARTPCGLVGVADAAGNDCYSKRTPRGVVACITPAFRPAALPLRHILPALAEGDTVVWKPSEHTPVCGQWLSRIFLEAGFIEGAINIVHGGDSVGRELALRPDVCAVVFAGARETAAEFHTAFAGDLHRTLLLEPSATSAVIVLKDADLDAAAAATIVGALRTTGQTPYSVDRIFVEAAIESDFLARLLPLIESVAIGPGLEPGTQMGPLVSADAHERYIGFRTEPLGEVLYDGFPKIEAAAENAWFAAPLVLRLKVSDYMAAVPSESRVPRVFVVPVDDAAQAVAAFNASPARSSLAVFTGDLGAQNEIRNRAAFERGYANLATVCTEMHVLSTGGRGSDASGPALTRMKTFTVGQTNAR